MMAEITVITNIVRMNESSMRWIEHVERMGRAESHIEF
jgi:hypothetical protein